MAFSAIIAHRIQRGISSELTDINIRAEEFTPNGVLEEMAYELKSQFIRKGGKHYGRFSQDTVDFPFSSWLNEYRAERLSFASFTKKAMEHFKSSLDNTDSPVDGYVFFIMEKIEAGEFLYVYLLEHMSGNYIDSNLGLAQSYHLDISNFTLASKINLLDWDTTESTTYLTLLRLRGDKVLSEAFTALVGFSDKHDIKGDTIEFLNLVGSFSNSLEPEAAKLTRNKAIDYCLEQNKAGKPVIISDLSKTLSADTKSYAPEKFARFMESQSSANVKEEFIADSSQLRSYVRISGRNDSLSMSFAPECLGKEIVYDPLADSLTIKNIPPALKARLLKHLQPE